MSKAETIAAISHRLDKCRNLLLFCGAMLLVSTLSFVLSTSETAASIGKFWLSTNLRDWPGYVVLALLGAVFGAAISKRSGGSAMKGADNGIWLIPLGLITISFVWTAHMILSTVSRDAKFMHTAAYIATYWFENALRQSSTYTGVAVLGPFFGAAIGKASKGSPSKGALHGLWLLPISVAAIDLVFIAYVVFSMHHR